jgi:hypothetical protein
MDSYSMKRSQLRASCLRVEQLTVTEVLHKHPILEIFKYILELHNVNKASENSCKSLLRALVIDTEDSVESTDKREVKECFEENLQ